MEVEARDLEIEEKELNQMPEYINLERKDREAFLSQIGNFSTEERAIFHLLCDNWDHEIGYAKFVTKINKKHPIDEKHLKTLMKKLRSSGCGILMTKFVRGVRGVDKIILTDTHSKFFYYYFINNEYQKNYEEISNNFVQDENFDQYEIDLSELVTSTLDLDNINQNFVKNEIHNMNIYKIVLENFETFYVTSETLQDLIKLAARKIRYYFKSDNFIAFIAKILNSSISKVRASINHFEVSTWKGLTVEMLKNQKVINGKFKNISKSFFQAVIITNKYCISELEQKDLQLENDKKLKEILKQIVLKIKENEFSPYNQESFNMLFDEFKEDAPEIKGKFYENYVDNKTKTGLTDVVFIGQHYIHQDNVYKVFLDKVALASSQLHEYYVEEFKTCIHSGSSDSTLLEGYPFESNIQDKLKADHVILHDLLNHKGILAESIIHFCKKRGHSQGKMHNLLAMYFIEGSSEFRKINRIFNLDLVELFEKAYSSMPGFKRFFIFIFGQYPKYVERFTGHHKVKRSHTPKPITRTGNGSNYSSSVISDYPSKRKNGKNKNIPLKKPKEYNKEQIEDAWENLDSELTKKKRT